MGSRARKKWQGDLLSTLPTARNEDDSENESDEENEEEPRVTKTKAGFALILDDDDDDDETSSDEDSTSDRKDKSNDEKELNKTESATEPIVSDCGKSSVDHNVQEEQDQKEHEEDLDAILNEFQQKDLKSSDTVGGSNKNVKTLPSEFSSILDSLDVRDLDLDWSLRNALHGASESSPPLRGGGRGRTQTQVFGTPTGNNIARPPHYVGGGMGMTSYDRLDENQGLIPWPYRSNDSSDSLPTYSQSSRWYTFQHSDTYARELVDYRRIEQSGDVNALLLFVAHHPFSTDALLQLVSVLNQTNHANEGQQLLKRCLWVYECAALQSFHKDLLFSDQHALMNIHRPENSKFFEALWQLVLKSISTGLHRTAWAVSRYLWALDPWRDPMGVLLVVDSFALACQTEKADYWIIQMVENVHTNQIWYGENEFDYDPTAMPTNVHRGKLNDMPNWAFSYALALFRAHGSDEETSNAALRRALRAYPGVVGILLQKLDIDTTGRSFRRDWVTILDKATQQSKDLHRVYLAQDDTITTSATLQAMDFIIKIFLERHVSHWGDDAVLQWLYDNLCFVLDETLEVPPLSPALMRYTRFKAAHYDTRVQQLPPDANIIDPALVQYAMVIDANRPRLLRRHQQEQQQRRQEEAAQLFEAAERQQRVIGGPPTGIIDPDWPIAEVFWRSFLPWNHVEGVPLPRR